MLFILYGCLYPGLYFYSIYYLILRLAIIDQFMLPCTRYSISIIVILMINIYKILTRKKKKKPVLLVVNILYFHNFTVCNNGHESLSHLTCIQHNQNIQKSRREKI